ncbi:hypothetical protein BV25DRAFT_1336661 [Artomyces pyxidatus]|uniref:Uncharacterized protein n=1 Tax=Artomyces pyxidatus TaxID=48021 RepID=A0ACB8SPY2_9AGAM|nr:hypothetical protein BV25DRAFT_1336661 [Artomyces pyxidatus]
MSTGWTGWDRRRNRHQRGDRTTTGAESARPGLSWSTRPKPRLRRIDMEHLARRCAEILHTQHGVDEYIAPQTFVHPTPSAPLYIPYFRTTTTTTTTTTFAVTTTTTTTTTLTWTGPYTRVPYSWTQKPPLHPPPPTFSSPPTMATVSGPPVARHPSPTFRKVHAKAPRSQSHATTQSVRPFIFFFLCPKRRPHLSLRPTHTTARKL